MEGKGELTSHVRLHDFRDSDCASGTEANNTVGYQRESRGAGARDLHGACKEDEDEPPLLCSVDLQLPDQADRIDINHQVGEHIRHCMRSVKCCQIDALAVLRVDQFVPEVVNRPAFKNESDKECNSPGHCECQESQDCVVAFVRCGEYSEVKEQDRDLATGKADHVDQIEGEEAFEI